MNVIVSTRAGMGLLRLPVVVVAALLSACSGLAVEPIGNAEQKSDANAGGIRFYQEAPFLFVYPDGKGGITTEVKWLPDTTQLMSAKPYAILSKNETTLEFLGSALTSATIVGDDTAVVKASLESLGKVLAIAANTGRTEGEIPVPKLYRIIVNGDGNTIGLSETATLDYEGNPLTIKVTLPGKTP